MADDDPDYEAAARALGFRETNGIWYHPNESWAFTMRFKSAKDIFDWWEHKNSPVAPSPS